MHKVLKHDWWEVGIQLVLFTSKDKIYAHLSVFWLKTSDNNGNASSDIDYSLISSIIDGEINTDSSLVGYLWKVSYSFIDILSGEEDAISISWMFINKGEAKRCGCGNWFKCVDVNPSEYGQ